MELIDKAAVVAEIEKIKCKVDDGSSYCNGWQHALRTLEIKLNTLEVQEVDLEKEIQAFSKMELEPIKIYDANVGLTITMHQLYQCARYFFELGLKQSSSDEYKLGESEIYLDDDGGEPPYDGEQWLDISCMEYEIPSDKFKVGDKIEIVIRKIKKGE